MRKFKIPKWLTTIFKVLLTGVALYVVFRKIETDKLLDVFRQLNFLYLLVATAFFVLSKIISSIRLNSFLQDVDIHVSERFNLKLYWLGMYYNLFLPGGIGGDGYKIYLLNKQTGVKVKSVFWAVMLDRITGLLALFCLAAILGYYLPFGAQLKYALWALVPVSILFFYFVIKILFSNFLSSFSRTNVQSFGVQIAQLVCSYFILKAININVDIGLYLFIFLVSSIVATIPFTIGGVGAREITFVYAAELLHLQMEPAIGLSFLFFFITAVVSLYGMVYSFKLKWKEELSASSATGS